jgi:hypothetical protein
MPSGKFLNAKMAWELGRSRRVLLEAFWIYFAIRLPHKAFCEEFSWGKSFAITLLLSMPLNLSSLLINYPSTWHIPYIQTVYSPIIMGYPL